MVDTKAIRQQVRTEMPAEIKRKEKAAVSVARAMAQVDTARARMIDAEREVATGRW
jgi:hypothetical protein